MHFNVKCRFINIFQNFNRLLQRYNQRLLQRYNQRGYIFILCKKKPHRESAKGDTMGLTYTHTHTHTMNFYRHPTIVFRSVSTIVTSPLIRDIINKTMMIIILMVINILLLLLLLLVLITLLLHLQVHFLIPIRGLRILIRDHRLPKSSQ